VRRLLALLVTATVLVTACGGGKEDDRSTGATGDPGGTPVRGGSLTYGLDAETGGGLCLPEAQLAGAGVLVARAVYDTLTIPDADGAYVPYLAEAVEPNGDFTEWTITVRDGVTFHDGTPLTAEVVKNNLDAYRGAEGEHARSPLLFMFALSPITSVEVAGERSVVVTTDVPWVAFDAYLFSNGRMGIMGQAQLDDTEGCERSLVGTGPFVLEDPADWEEGRQMRLARNADYWQVAPDGEAYPYLDELVFEAIVEPEQRINALLAGDVQLSSFAAANDLLDLRFEAEAGTLTTFETSEAQSVAFVLPNVSRPPLDDVRIRRAIALAVDRDELRDVILRDQLELANGPFAPGTPGSLDDTGFPVQVDRAEAERLVAEHEAEHGPLRTLTFQTVPTADAQARALFLQQTLATIGVEVDIRTVQQDALVDAAIGGDYDLMSFVNYPGGDPDELAIWFRGRSPVNFARFADAEVDRLLDEGRSETDPETRAQVYEDLNRRLGEQAYHLWMERITALVAATPEAHGHDATTAPALPGGATPSEGLLGTGLPHGFWVEG
jgi:peptide/nickel transport system substrate-binding protein